MRIYNSSYFDLILGFSRSNTAYREITKIRVLLSNGADKKERTKRNEHIGMQRGVNFTIVSTTLLIGLNTNLTKSSQSSMYINPLFSNQLPYNKISSESK